VENTDTAVTGLLLPSNASVHEMLFMCAPLTCEGNVAEMEDIYIYIYTDHHDGANNDRNGLIAT
jgi:hypothetical protein